MFQITKFSTDRKQKVTDLFHAKYLTTLAQIPMLWSSLQWPDNQDI